MAQRLDGSGNVVSSDLCDAYGAKLASDDTTSDPHGYNGQWGYYTDAETGLVLCTNRYYDSANARWITRDQIGYEGGINLYGYVGNNPVFYRDRFGLAETFNSSLKDQAKTFFQACGHMKPGCVSDLDNDCRRCCQTLADIVEQIDAWGGNSAWHPCEEACYAACWKTDGSARAGMVACAKKIVPDQVRDWALDKLLDVMKGKL